MRAYAVGLHRLGLKRGETIAIVGANRPKLYWSVMAAQMLGAMPVPVYADAVADELAFVLAHAEVRFAAVEDQEQVDKILSVKDRLPKLEQMVYDETRGLRDYDHSHLHPIDEIIADGAQGAGRRPGRRQVARRGDRHRQGHRSLHHPLHLRHHRHLQGRGADRRALDHRGAATVAFDHLNENDVSLAYLPLAWVGDHYLNYAQGLVAGFCIACPEIDRHRDGRTCARSARPSISRRRARSKRC